LPPPSKMSSSWTRAWGPSRCRWIPAGLGQPAWRTSTSLNEARHADQTAFSAYDLEYAATHAKNWSWDPTDLVWEAATESADAAPIQVLRFRSDFNFAPVVAHFRQRGFFTGAQACRVFNPRLALGPAATSMAIAALRHKYAVDKAHRYDALAVAYRDEGKRPLGLTVLEYATRAVALADLPIRRSIAQSGISPRMDEPYSHMFTLEQAAAVGNAVVLTMHPVSGRPQVFMHMVVVGDLAFAWRPCS